MKRKWNGMNGLASLGLSRSTLRTLGSVERALDSVGGIGAAARAAETWKAEADLSGLIGGAHVESITDMGARSALSAISAAEANSNAALGKSSASLAGNLLKDAAGIGAPPLPSVAQDLALGKASHAYRALDALSGFAKGASSLYSVGKVASLAAAIPKSTALSIPRTMLGAEDGLSAARSAVSFFGSGNRASDLFASAWRDGLLAGLPKDILSGAYSGLPGLLGANAVKNLTAWQDVMSISETSWLFGPPRGFGLLGASGADLLRGTLPAFDALSALNALDAVRGASGLGLGGLLDTIGRIDFEALRRAARIREARRPRTRIGFAALDAYDGFCMNHPWVADKFLVDYLGVEPNEDTREALWQVLKWTFERTVTWPAKWLMIDDEGAVRYLRAAVHKNARRVRRDKERPDRVWWEERDPATKKKVELPPPTLQPEYTLEFMMKRSGNPADIVVPPPDERGRVLQMLYVEGTEQDRIVVGMIIAGFDLAAIARAVGWPEVQRFQRKAQRWRIIKLAPPSGG